MVSEQSVWFTRLSILATLLLLLLGTGVARVNASQVTTSPATRVSRRAVLPCNPVTDFDPNNFSNPTQIDNQWLPMIPGTQLILEGTANQGGGPSSHQVIFTVTDVTKIINGVRTLVIWDRDINEGQLSEAELAFFAQDNAGNVWNLGEYPEEYENGQLIGAPSTWIAGLADAQGGVHMLVTPQLGTPRYLQGVAPAIQFLDCAKVFRMSQIICVPFSCFENVLVTDETSPLDPGNAHQRKYHAPGVGIVQVSAVNDPEAETLVLVELLHLSSTELAEVGDEVLSMDENGYQISPDVYGLTPPAEGPSLQVDVFTFFLPVILK